MKKVIILLCILFLTGCENFLGSESENKLAEVSVLVEGIVLDDSTNCTY